MLTAYAVNAPKEFEARRRELRARLRDDPQMPAARQWTDAEMQAAAQRLVASVLNTGKTPIQ